MFLKEIEVRQPEGMMKIAFTKLRDAGQSVPEIMHRLEARRSFSLHDVHVNTAVSGASEYWAPTGDTRMP